jgi:hypothetical protein
LKAEAPTNIQSIVVTPEVSHAPMSSLKDESRNNSSMSVTAPVSHVEMWPYVASAAALSESHLATAILIFPLAMTFPVLVQSPEFSACTTPHDVAELPE